MLEHVLQGIDVGVFERFERFEHLVQTGTDLARARRKRRPHLTVEIMAERVGVAKSTNTRIEKGDPAVAMGAYAMVLFVLGSARRWAIRLTPGAMSKGFFWTKNGCRSG